MYSPGKIFIQASLALLLLLCSQHAQSKVMVRATVSSTTVEINEPFVLTYVISGVRGTLILPSNGTIEILQKIGESQQIIVRNGLLVREREVKYIAVANQIGKVTLEPMEIKDGSDIYKSNTIVMNVVDQGQNSSVSRSNQPQTNKRNNTQVITRPKSSNSSSSSNTKKSKRVNELIFLKTSTDKTSAYVGEPITATTKLYYQVNFETDPLTALPKYNGFWHESIDVGDPMQNIGTEYINGEAYNVLTIGKEVLYPLESGELSISPYVLEGIARVPEMQANRYDDPLEDLFDDPFFNQGASLNRLRNKLKQLMEERTITMGYRIVRFKLNSGTVKIKAKPLPLTAEGATPNLGRYSIQARVTKHKLSTDDIDTLEVTISGMGNPAFISVPSIQHPELEILSTYEQDSITSRFPMRGYKKIYYLFSATNSGEIIIPPISTAYFDPSTEQMGEVSTPQITLEVEQGEVLSQKESIVRSVPRNIHSIDKAKDTQYWITEPWAWAGWSLPFLAYMFLVFYTRNKEKIQANPKLYKEIQANKIARQRLENAKAYMDSSEGDTFYTEVSKALWLYVSDKSGIPLSAMNKEAAQKWFRTRDIAEDTQRKFMSTVQEAELHLYASDHDLSGMPHEYQNAIEVLSLLESELS